MGAQSGNRGELDQPERVSQMRVHVIKRASHLTRRQPASVRDRRTLRRAIAAQQMHAQHDGEPLQIKAAARTTFAQLAPSERAEPPNHRVLDPDGRPDREIICLIEGFLQDLRDEGYIECERKEGRRRAVADPEWQACIADVCLTVRNGDRSYAIALGPAPVHLKGFAVVYCYDYLSRGDILTLYRARSAVSKCDRSDTQVLVECKPVGWFARGKVDQVTPQMMLPGRSHSNLQPDGRRRLIALSQARPYVAAPPRSKPDFGPWFGRWPSRLGAFPSLFFDAVGRA